VAPKLRYFEVMAYVTVRDLPEHAHRVLAARAKAAHQSLTAYVTQLLVREATTPTVEEILDEAAALPGGTSTFDDVVAAMREAHEDEE
jgi:plasmid stability protein